MVMQAREVLEGRELLGETEVVEVVAAGGPVGRARRTTGAISRSQIVATPPKVNLRSVGQRGSFLTDSISRPRKVDGIA